MPRRVTWVRAAFKDFGAFPEPVQRQMIVALRMAASGEKAEIARPMKGLGSGTFEIAVRHRGDAFRTVYAVQMDDDVWVAARLPEEGKEPGSRRRSRRST
jgi:phage-related protein